MTKDGTGKECGPLWQLEQNLKHYESVAAAARSESIKKLHQADEADADAEKYRKAIAVLQEADK
jgi:hypothetical protein